MTVTLQGINTVILDIEGTICPISFVKDVMYPAALDTLQELLDSNSNSSTPFPPPMLESYTKAFPTSATTSAAAFLDHVTELTRTDSKTPELKALQGLLWRTGFENGSLVSPLYPDVRPALTSWRSNGHKLAIFSSGSVAAQKLFLTYTGVEGSALQADVKDLNPWIGANFDTVNAGPKNQKESYAQIAKELEVESGAALFLSDNVAEIRAALAAGLQALVVDRPGNAPLSEQDRTELTVTTSFQEIKLQQSQSRVLRSASRRQQRRVDPTRITKPMRAPKRIS